MHSLQHQVKKKRTSNSSGKIKHTLEREPPLPIYIGLNIHALTRSNSSSNCTKMGISISYDRVVQLAEWIAISVWERFEEDVVVSPACLRKGLFIAGALDNIDHNPSSTNSLTSFHGTGISLFQFSTKTKTGESRLPVKIPPPGMKSTLSLTSNETHSHLHQGSEREELPSVCGSLGGDDTSLLCIGSCELLVMDAFSHQRHELFARSHQG